MKVGDLVRCKWQPRCGGWNEAKTAFIKMKHVIENEVGIITKADIHGRFQFLFIHMGYEHTLASNTLEVISEDR